MRVIAKEVCFIGGARRRIGQEFEYDGPMQKDGSLPAYLVPADPEARKALADVKKVKEGKDLDALRAAAGPKRPGTAGVTKVDTDLGNAVGEGAAGKVHAHWPTTDQEKAIARSQGVELVDPPAPEGSALL